MNDYIEIYSLEGCGYSIRAISILENNDINHKVINVKLDNMSKYKKKNNMNTFPQIFYVNKGERTKIGGSSDLNDIIIFNDKVKNDYKNLSKLLDKNNLNINRSALVKILYLINKK